MSTDTDTGTWFDRLYREYNERGEAMFAFSKKQVEEAFEGDLAVTYEQVQQEWRSYGAGLLVKGTAYVEFLRRMDADFAAWEAGQPLVRVQHVGTDYWDRPCYKVISHAEGAPVRVGQVLRDVNLLPVGEARTLHSTTSEGEPESQLNIHVVHVPVSDTSDTSTEKE
jgi:hypothetical protein